MQSVSIVTISQYARANFLEVLAECIRCQDYPNIIEWVIVDTSFVGYQKTQFSLVDMITKFINSDGLPKVIFHKATKNNIGGWRNEGNTVVSGDIVVCMDDDDYYPPNRVSHAVEKLKDKNKLIAGCDKLFFYDIHHKHMYQFNGFGPMHSTNNCMAYWAEYGRNHFYDENVTHAEEDAFTNKFTIPMEQLDADKTVLQFSHDANTYNKKEIILNNIWFPPKIKYISRQDFTPEQFIKNDKIWSLYQKIFEEKLKPVKSPYDIVYYCGVSPQWSPKQNDLGGSEQSVKFLSSQWSRLGKKVAVYGSLSFEGNYEGVDYMPCKKFKFWDQFDVLILWRLHGVYPFLSYDLKANKIIIDLHDHTLELYQLMIQNKNKISKCMIKSEFQKELIEAYTGQQFPLEIVPNGLQVELFSKPIPEPRFPFRMCYTSCYGRGLQRLLKDIWPLIYKFEPKAEFHIYYGMDLQTDENFKNEMRQLLAQPGVMDHGRQSNEIINREKHLSTFHFFYTDWQEIDCISIRESLVAGCIPIISNVKVFKYRQGIHIQWLPNIPDFNMQIASTIVELMHNKELQEKIRKELKDAKTITSWEQTAKEWLK